jgi:metal-responsive CopG/Arc/MetJ family transcriptional regulator
MTVKTAISLDQALFEEAETLAATLKVSRSQLYGLALRDYLRQQANRAKLEQLNRVYGDVAPTAAGLSLAQAHKRSHRRLLEGTW